MGRIVSYTSEQMDELAKHSLTDWDRVLNMKDEDIDFSDFPDAPDDAYKYMVRGYEAETQEEISKLATKRYLVYQREKALQENLAKKQAKEAVKKLKESTSESSHTDIIINLSNKTINKLKKMGANWTNKVKDIIEDFANKAAL